MAQYKLVPSDVSTALAEQNVEAAPGQFGERSNQTFQYTIRYKGRLQQPEEFENIVIKSLPDGEVLRLKDIAEIQLDRLGYNFTNRVDGHKSVTCIVYQMAGTNATQTISDIEALLDEASKTLPTGLKLNISMNANDFLFASIHEVLKTLIEAFILVFIVVYIFLQDFTFHIDSDYRHSGSSDRYFLHLVPGRIQFELVDVMCARACYRDCGRRCDCGRRECACQA